MPSAQRRILSTRVLLIITVALTGAFVIKDQLASASTPAPPAVVAVRPERLLDTRQGAGKAAAGSVTRVKVHGEAGIPGDAKGVVVNLTAVEPSAAGHLTLYPCDANRPHASNVNYRRLSNQATTAISRIGGGGYICIHTPAATHILVDVTGFVPGASGMGLMNPARLVDTRPGNPTIDGVHQGAGSLTAGAIQRFQIAGRGGIPRDASSAVLTVTAVTPVARGHMTIYPCNIAKPNASNLTYAAGWTRSNTVVTELDPDGAVCVHTHSTSHLVIDAAGHFPTGTATGLAQPTRVLDTRPNFTTADRLQQGTGVATNYSITRVKVAGRAGVPSNATAALLNVTSTQSTGPGHVTVYPCTSGLPPTSTLNHTFGAANLNLTFTALSADGSVCLYTSTTAHLIVDVAAAWTTPGAVGTARQEPTRPARQYPAESVGSVACLGVYNGGPAADQDTFNQFGVYPGVSSTYLQPDQRVQIEQETARIRRGTMPNITITTKGTNRIEALGVGPSHPGYAAARDWLQTYVNDLATLAAVDPSVPVYGTIEHEFKVKTRTGMVTGESARSDHYGRALDLFFAMANAAHPNLRSTYWIVGYDRDVEAAVASHFRTLPRAIVFDPYAQASNETVESIVSGDLAWIRSQSWYVGQEIGLGEFGMTVANGDNAMATFYTDTGARLAKQGISWAVLFNRSRDNDHQIAGRDDGRAFPNATNAYSNSLQAATPC